MSDRETIGVYDQRAAEYAEVTASDGPDDTLAQFIASLPQKARVLDLGCGPGASAAHMARAGHEVLAWDASAEMIALARAHPGVEARQAVFDELATIEAGSLDAVWANFSLLHAARDALPVHLDQIARALRPGGVFHIAVKEGQGSQRDRLGRLYTFYSEPELAQMLRQAGLTPGVFQRGIDKGLAGDLSPWISVTAHA